MIEYTCLLSILKFLDLKGLYNLALTNEEMKKLVFDYIKRDRIIDCKGDKILYDQLIEKGYRTDLGEYHYMPDFASLYPSIILSMRIDKSALIPLDVSDCYPELLDAI